MSGMDWVRQRYAVPARRGGRVEYSGDRLRGPQLGTITGTRGGYVRIRLDGGTHSRSYHPTWELRYLTKAEAAG